MIKLSGFEWLMVDMASRWGHDKIPFAERIQWAQELLEYFKVDTLEELKTNLTPWIDSADEPAAFTGAALAIWDTYKGRTSNWNVSQDSASSGCQIMSLLMKCETGMRHTGTLGDRIPDLYTDVSGYMNEGGLDIPRKVLKKGMIPHMYASEAAPKAIFEDAYPAFLSAYSRAVPMAQIMSNALVAAWDSNATEHCWTLPDGYEVRVPVLVSCEKTLPMGKHSYAYQYSEIGTKVKGKAAGTKSLSANVIHSMDAFLLRELNRRCNYSLVQVEQAIEALTNPRICQVTADELDMQVKLKGLEKLSERFNQVSIVALEYITPSTVTALSAAYKSKLLSVLHGMLEHVPFEVTNVHDDFSCHANHVNQMKVHYNQLMVELYESTWGYEVIEWLSGKPVIRRVPDATIAAQILCAEYSIS